MTVADDKRESGTSLMFIGLAVWVADLLVVFFLPASVRLGRQELFLGIIVVLAVVGLVLMLAGYSRRSYGGPEE
jgi:uncharacterized membrane protein